MLEKCLAGTVLLVLVGGGGRMLSIVLEFCSERDGRCAMLEAAAGNDNDCQTLLKAAAKQITHEQAHIQKILSL